MGDNSLSNYIHKALIIAYKEDTSQLEACLTEQGFNCAVMRQKHQPEHQNFSSSYLCLLNHLRAWQSAAASEQTTLIVEADFVPVKGLGHLPLPYDPARPNVGLAWLYTCAPQIYSVTAAGHAIGYSTSMVAYLVTPAAARYLQVFADKIMSTLAPTQYSSWDSSIEAFLRQQKLDCFVPWRNYGEHGGRPNVEHRQAGLSAAHRADVLYGPLAFMPPYATTSYVAALQVFTTRLKARSKGMARLFLGKYVRWKIVRKSSTRWRLLKFATGRYLTLIP